MNKDIKDFEASRSKKALLAREASHTNEPVIDPAILAEELNLNRVKQSRKAKPSGNPAFGSLPIGAKFTIEGSYKIKTLVKVTEAWARQDGGNRDWIPMLPGESVGRV